MTTRNEGERGVENREKTIERHPDRYAVLARDFVQADKKEKINDLAALDR